MVGSFALNMGTGVFLSIMFREARRRSVRIPLPMGPCSSRLWVPVLLYYCAAVLYDYVMTVTTYFGFTALLVVSLILAAVFVSSYGQPTSHLYPLKAAVWLVDRRRSPSMSHYHYHPTAMAEEDAV